jgi:hypothetical protein
MKKHGRPVLGALVLVFLCTCTSSPTESDEYRRIVAERDAARGDLGAAEERLEAIENQVSDLKNTVSELGAQVQEAEEQASRAYVALHAVLSGVEPHVRTCATRVSGALGDDWRDESVIVGSLALVGLSEFSEQPPADFEPRDGRYIGTKVLAVVEGGAVVSVVVPEAERKHVSLIYDISKWRSDNLYAVSDGDLAVTLDACTETRTTQFNGGFVVAGARCSELDVYNGEHPDPERVVVSFGVGTCAVP